MLVELAIENYAVIESLRVRFHEGFHAVTGETGSGKSIVVDALGLLMGGRASADMVRSGAVRARVSGIFDLEGDDDLRGRMEEAGVQVEDGELLLEREVLASGKSRAFAGGRVVTASFLRELAPLLGDIHGQHDQQWLFAPEAQLEMLDAFSETGGLLGQLGSVFREWRGTGAELAELDRAEQEKLRLLDLWTFQRTEIESASVAPAEDERLEADRRILQNVSRLQESANAAYEALYDSPGSAGAQLRIALRRTEELARIDPKLNEVVEVLKPAAIAVEEASHSLRHYLGTIEADPARLEEIESRLAALDKLKRKYGPTVAEVLAFLDQVKARIEAIESAGERRATLQKQRTTLEAKYQAIASELSVKRSAAASILEKRVEAELGPLAMEGSVFEVSMETGPWTERGIDDVAFLLSANLGEEPKALDRIASGGELSRVALALKTCVVSAKKGRTLVFDEVDAGIGGAAADAVGARLRRLAEGQQVLCVTHLAQIAGYASHHYAVEKREANGRTATSIQELSGADRTREISRMLSGRTTPEALRHAEQLLKAGAG